MANDLSSEQKSVVTVLLRQGRTIKEIAKFAELDADAVTAVARSVDIEPEDPAQRRAKDLYTSPDGYAFQEIAAMITDEGLAPDGGPLHHLTVASWAKNHGWSWGGADDGNYAPERTAATPARSRYLLRMSKALDAEMNDQARIDEAAAAAWKELEGEGTAVVQLAVIRGAAAAGVTDLTSVKRALLDAHGDEIRNAKA